MQKVSNLSGIWRYQDELPPINSELRLSLGEGGTSLIQEGNFYFKLESENPTGSVKDRSMAYQIAAHASKKSPHLVLSSSGNAAISASEYAKIHNIPLSLFLSTSVSEGKLKRLEGNENLHLTETPLKDSLIFSQENSYTHLRQSLDPLSLPGYSTIAFELYEDLGERLSECSIFFPVSSGTTLVGVQSGFQHLIVTGRLTKSPKIFAIQSQAHFPVAQHFLDSGETPETITKSLADSLVSPTTPRLSEIIKIIRDSDGLSLVATESELIKAWEALTSFGVDSSAEGALAFAGAISCENKGIVADDFIILITGKRHE